MKTKKIFKGMTAAAIAAVLATTMVPMTAFAVDDPGKISITATTLQNTEANSVLAYKVAVKDSSSTEGWSWNTTDVLTDTTGLPTFTAMAGYTNNGKDAKELAYKLKSKLKGDATSVAFTNDGSGNYTSNSDVADGYYLVIVTPQTNAAVTYQPILIEKKSGEQATVNAIKASKIDIDKTITGVEQGSYPSGTYVPTSGSEKDVAQVNIGQTVNFQIKTTIPTYDPGILDDTRKDNFQNFTITDTPADGKLSLNKDSINVYVVDSGTTTLNDGNKVTEGLDTYSLNFNDTTNVFTIEFAPEYVLTDDDDNGIADNANKDVFVTFSGQLTDSAVIGDAGNTNNAKITFSNDYSTGSGSAEKDDNVQVYTIQLNIKKLKTGSTEALSGAEFVIYQKDGANYKYVKADGTIAEGITVAPDSLTDEQKNTVKFTTGTDGLISLEGISAGAYFAQEIKAPENYKLDKTERTITINPTFAEGAASAAGTVTFTCGNRDITNTNNVFQLTVTNTEGASLPGTGGIGTTIFTIAGVGVVVLAGVMLVVYMRKRKADEE